jgi:hypothetical protein
MRLLCRFAPLQKNLQPSKEVLNFFLSHEAVANWLRLILASRINFQYFAFISKTYSRRRPRPARKRSGGVGGMVFAAIGSMARNW